MLESFLNILLKLFIFSLFKSILFSIKVNTSLSLNVDNCSKKILRFSIINFPSELSKDMFLLARYFSIKSLFSSGLL